MGQKMNNNNNKTKENQPLIEKTMIAITIVEHLCAKNYTRKQPFLSFTLHTHTHTHTHTKIAITILIFLSRQKKSTCPISQSSEA